MDAFVYALAFAAIAFAVFAAASLFDRRITLGFALLAAVYLGLDDLVTGLASLMPAFRIVEGSWNWPGKLYSLALSVAVLFALGIRPQAAGLTLSQRHLKVSLVALLLFAVWGFTLGIVFDPPRPSLETLLFQASMPGLSEELVYRGIAPALLMGFIRGRESDPGIPWAVIMATALVFGCWHGLGYSNGSFSFDTMSALFPFIGSIAGGWLRFKSGSLLFPVLVHGVANVTFQLASLV